MADSPVDALYNANRTLSDYLESAGEVSLQSSADESFRKILLLSAASYFEHRVTRIILEFVEERANSDALVLGLIRKKAIDRQYHTYFDWSGKNANSFFSLFGPAFAEHMKELIKTDEGLRGAIQAFLELGDLRNQLVHQNFASFSLEKTVKEIFELFESARSFIDCLPERLRDHIFVP